MSKYIVTEINSESFHTSSAGFTGNIYNAELYKTKDAADAAIVQLNKTITCNGFWYLKGIEYFATDEVKKKIRKEYGNGSGASNGHANYFNNLSVKICELSVIEIEYKVVNK
jgi:hypothetical protein